MSGTSIKFDYGESSSSDAGTSGNHAVLVNAPEDQNDMSVLPGSAAPEAGTAYEAFAPGIHWTIRAGESVWSQTIRATE